MRVNIEGLINRLDSLKERLNDLSDNLDSLEELEQEEIAIENVQQYLQNDDTFNLSIALGILEQVDKLDKALEIIKNKLLIGCFTEQDNYSNYVTATLTYGGDELKKNMMTEKEYELVKEILA